VYGLQATSPTKKTQSDLQYEKEVKHHILRGKLNALSVNLENFKR
jgi:hypothetical protein